MVHSPRLGLLGRAVIGALVFFVVSCSRGDKEKPKPLPVGPASVKPPPADHLEPGELGEGKETAYDFRFPRGFVVTRRFGKAAYARGNAKAEQVDNYVRKRVKAASVEVGAGRTIFQKARVLAAKQKRLVRVEVVRQRYQTELVVRDLSTPPPVKGLTEEERWRRAGLKPNGQPLDPNKMQLAEALFERRFWAVRKNRSLVQDGADSRPRSR